MRRFGVLVMTIAVLAVSAPASAGVAAQDDVAAAVDLAPLNTYWKASRGDNYLVGTEEGDASARAAGYTFVRREGFGWATPVPYTVPLYLFYDSSRQDNFVTATEEGIDSAAAAGYRLVRIEGYVMTP